LTKLAVINESKRVTASEVALTVAFADDNGRVHSRRTATPNPARGARTALRMKTEPDAKAA
jgi:hypothetical protein